MKIMFICKKCFEGLSVEFESFKDKNKVLLENGWSEYENGFCCAECKEEAS